jgi:signal transduction histidine kinase
MLVLQVLQGADRGRKFVLPEGEPQLIGRSSESLPITDSTVSRRHAELTPDGDRWFLRDLESANGTFVNGHRITARTELEPGDQVRCGSTLLLFTLAADQKKESPVRVMEGEAFDVTVVGTVSANEESMVLAAPDPIKAAIDHLRVIYDLTALTASTLDQDDLLNKVMDLVFEEFSPDRGFILLMDRTDAAPDLAAVRYRERPKTTDEGRIPVSRTIVQQTLEQGEGLLSTNAMNDLRFESGDSVRDYGIRSAICVPIKTGQQTFGVIHIDSQLANFTFTDAQLLLLNAIGQHTGLAILNMQLVDSKMQTERLAAMGRTVASLSHSIKNILQGLRGGADAVELALNRDDLDLAREGWPILARNLDRIYALTLNMLAYSRQAQLDIELASLNGLVEEVAALVQPQCDRRRVGLILDLDADVPPIPFDTNALHQALMNLVTNAAEAAPPRKGVVTVKTRYLAETHQVELSVCDNGPGVDPSLHTDIFQAFSTTKGQRGTGLGLAVTRKIVQEHRGRIELNSKPDEGATFVVVLPSDHPSLDSAETKLPRAIPQGEMDDEF